MYKDQNISLCRPNKCGHYDAAQSTNTQSDAIAALRHLSLSLDTYMAEQGVGHLTFDVIKANRAAKDVLLLHT